MIKYSKCGRVTTHANDNNGSNQSQMRGKTDSGFNSGHTQYSPVHNLLSCGSLYKSGKIKIHEAVILPTALYSVEIAVLS
jgi:hypothetical protein